MVEPFIVSRRRHDERYWADVWASAAGRVAAAAEKARVRRALARDYLHQLGIRSCRGVDAPSVHDLLVELLQPGPVEALGRMVTHDEIEALSPDQRVATAVWLEALEKRGSRYACVVPGFLLQRRDG